MSLHPQKTSEKVMKAALSSVCTAENRFSRTRLPALIVFGRDIWRSGGVTWQGTHAAGPTESTFDGQNLHPQPRYGGTLIEAAITESTLSPTNPLSAAIYVLDESRFNDEVPSISECLSVASLAISPSSRGQAVRAPNPFLLAVCGSLTLRFIFMIL